MTKEEKRKKHLSDLNKARLKRYYETHQSKQLSIRLSVERFDKFASKLKEQGITQKQFIEDAIDKFLNGS